MRDSTTAERRTPRGPLAATGAMLALFLTALLSVAIPSTHAQDPFHGDPPPTTQPSQEELEAELFGTTTPGEPALPDNLAPPVKLADVEWAGLLWGSAEGYRPAPILSSEVEMRVTGLVARTRLTQHFENTSGAWMEGVYLFPLPDDAAVDRLRMVIGDRVLEGEIQEKAEARRTYEAAKEEGKKATLVEQHRPNVFTTRVANVAPGEAVEVVLELQQAVAWDAGEMSLRFPTVVNPRFFPAPGEAPELRLGPPLLASAAAPLPPARAAQVSDSGHVCPGPASHGGVALAVRRSAGAALESVAGGLTTAGLGFPDADPDPPEPVNPVTITVELDAGFPLEYLDSPYHRVDVEVVGGTVGGGASDRHRYRVRLADGAPVSADRDFELVWAPRPGDAPRAAVFTEEHRGDTYSLLMVLPPDRVGSGAWRPLDRELVFVLDVSGSMHGASIGQAKRALNTVLDGLHPADTFNVIAFSDRARALFPDSLAADAETVGKARDWVDALEADGGTNMLPALAAALEGSPGYPQPGARTVKQVIFLTDGAVGNEAELFRFIAENLGRTRLFTVGIGAAPNAHFMRRAAEEGRGTYTFIGDPAEVALKVEVLARKLESPVLTGLEVEWDDPTAETWPQRLGDLYAGEPLVVTARTVTRGDSVRLAGRTDGHFWQSEVRLAPAPEARAGARPGGDTESGGDTDLGGAAIQAASLAAGDGPTAGVRQLWARRKIAALQATLASGADPAEVRRRVVEVALDHHLVSAYTSLVAVDRTPSRPAGEGLDGQRTPNVHPAGWTPPGTLPVGATAWPFHLAAGLALLAFALLAVTFVLRGGGMGARGPDAAGADRHRGAV